MFLGAIDIGSNAIRFQVSSISFFEGEWYFQKIEHVRYPLRLGEDVFSSGTIAEAKVDKLIKLLQAFKAMFEVFEVKDFKVCATSAMRDAKNGKDVVSKIYATTGIKIEIIMGDMEANMMEKAILKNLDSQNYLHIDVGGGSTEINLISKNEKIISKSFNIGAVRGLLNGNSEEKWKEMNLWIKANIIPSYANLKGVGTGGNMRRLHELTGEKSEKSITWHKLKRIKREIERLTMEDRIHKLKLNPDRADVIVPAAEIYLNIMEWAACKEIYAPSLGLIDGIIADLFENKYSSPPAP